MKRRLRKNKNRKKKKRAEKELQEKMNMFDKLSDACDACEKTFDKRDKSMVQSWSVVVKEAEGVVRLYCPNCWGMAIKLIKEVENG